MFKKYIPLTLSVCLTLTTLTSHAEEWDKQNDPSNMSQRFTYNFNALPLSGKLSEDKTPWQSTYWPTKFGSIAYRWQQFTWENPNQKKKFPHYFDVTPPSLSQLRAMTQAQINLLSPAEKFDIYLGKYDYPLTKSFLKRKNKYVNAEYWAGICDAWSAASIYHAEPLGVTITNKDGIVIPFTSNDVKALMSFAYKVTPVKGYGRSGRAGEYRFFKNQSQDLNPGSFHIALASSIGLMNQSIIMELDPTKEIWNYPIYKYESVVLEKNIPVTKDSAKAAVTRYKMQTRIYYPSDDEALTPQANPTVGTANYEDDWTQYTYFLEIDAYGRIVGGEWIEELNSDNETNSKRHPDFMWKRDKITYFGNGFEALNDLYKPSR